ncbi:F-type H+-transporting ATPase subunit a [Marininema mesophilum]|uniref:ATP synthase subunit a n=1 Tax=Marininema mesophilum TaxID=1048340 RepID=A0A1H2TBJ2_9BACL|nr:F0F1 ATP synthase subunit A [Marininema mesophilum]SDW41228.1 F-type H+-transporting ATPase subunit a [Marininema mesophilum]
MEATPKVEFLGLTFDLTVIFASLLTAAIVLVITILGTRGRAMRPGKFQNFVEMILEFIRGVNNMSFNTKRAERYLSFSLTLFLYIFIANQLGVLLMISADVHHPIPALGLTEEALSSVESKVALFKSPTADINVAIALAFAITIYAHIMGVRKSPKGYFTHYVKPYFWMLPLHLIDEVAKPVTHAMRLWANIFAGEVLIVILLSFGAPLITGAPLLVWIGFSLFVGTIQAYIFTVLATVYISQKTSDEH